MTILLAFGFLLLTFVLIFFLELGVHPPGYTGDGAYAMFAIFLGAFFIAGRCRRTLPFLLLGAAGAMLLLPFHLRCPLQISVQISWIALRSPENYIPIIGWSVFVIAIALLTRAAAIIRWELVQEIPRANPLCRHCGYDIRSATHICPECGNTFDFADKKTYSAMHRYWNFKWLIRRVLIVSMGTLLPLTAIYAALYWRSDRSAVAAIGAMGGEVDSVCDLPEDAQYWPRALHAQFVTELFSHGEMVIWRNQPIIDEQLRCLMKFRQLTEVHIDNAPLTGSGFAVLDRLPHFEHLYLPGSCISDNGLASIAKLSSLTQLQLDGTGVTDSGMASVTDLHNLQSLWLERTLVSDAGLTKLVNLKSLKYMSLTGSHVTVAGRTKFNVLRPDVTIEGP